MVIVRPPTAPPDGSGVRPPAVDVGGAGAAPPIDGVPVAPGASVAVPPGVGHGAPPSDCRRRAAAPGPNRRSSPATRAPRASTTMAGSGYRVGGGQGDGQEPRGHRGGGAATGVFPDRSDPVSRTPTLVVRGSDGRPRVEVVGRR